MKIVRSLLSAVTLLSLVISSIVIGEVNIQTTSANQFETQVDSKAEQTVQKSYGKMPLLFEKNKGQTGKQVQFISRAQGFTLYLAETEAVFQLRIADLKLGNEETTTKNHIPNTKSDALRMKFVGANSSPTMKGVDEAITKTNYYIGKKKFENVPNYQKVNYKNLYEGIDADFYGNSDNQLEFDFVIAPNADTNQIKLNFDGAKNISIDEAGNLVVKTENAELIQQKPFAYQEIDGQKNEVISRYVVSGNSVKFELGEYDKSQTLTIDPATRYLTYIGGDNGNDNVEGVAVDSQLNTYLTGTISSTDFTPGNVPRDPSDEDAVFVAKLNPIASQFLYLTILDGKDFDFAADIAVDASGNAYITGSTKSNNFPVFNAYQSEGDHCVPITVSCISGFFRGDAFVTKLGVDGGLLYSSYLRGRDEDKGQGIAVGTNGLVYVTGYTESFNFPKINEYQSLGKAFLTVMPTDGNAPIYSTRFDANSFEFGDVAVDSAGNAYIVTNSDNNNTPVKNAFQPNNGGGKDAVIAKFNPFSSGESSLVYATYLGGAGTEIGKGIAVTPQGKAFVTGVTGSFPSSFPLLNAVDSTNQINEAFLTVFNSNGSLFASTFLGGNGAESGNAVTLDVGGVAYVTGSTESTDFPRVFAFQNTKSGTQDAFVTKIRLGANGTSAILSSSFLGGSGNESGESIAVSGNKHIYLGGSTTSTNLPTSGGSVKSDVILGSSFTQGFTAHILDTQRDTVGVYNPFTTEFLLRNSNSPTGSASLISVNFGIGSDIPVTADWNGDGIDTVGTFNNGVWKYRNVNIISGYPTTPPTFNFGQSGDIPLAGDWNGDGIETPGVFRPSTQQFLLSDSLVNPLVDHTIKFGQNGDRPVVGDWDGDGIDSPGVYRPSDGRFRLTNRLTGNPPSDNTFQLGAAEDLPIAGDWNADGLKDVGLWKPSTQTFSFDTNKTDGADLSSLIFGSSGNLPLAGEWEGRP
ncbi:FG-GAP-like repeat-containing protein [soil metagenome]